MLGLVGDQNMTGYAMPEKCNVLFLRRANSARGIMAEALLRELGAGRFEAFSAGIERTQDIHPLTLDQLRPTIGDLDKFRTKSRDVYATADAPAMNFVIATCDEVSEQYGPAFAGRPTFCQWNFADPLNAGWDDAEQARAVEQIFRQILRRISIFVALPLKSMRAAEQRIAVNSLDEHAPPSLMVN